MTKKKKKKEILFRFFPNSNSDKILKSLFECYKDDVEIIKYCDFQKIWTKESFDNLNKEIFMTELLKIFIQIVK